MGQYEQSEALLRASLAGQRRIHGDDDTHTIRAMGNFGLLLMARGKLDEAEALFRAAEEAERIHREALEKMQRVLGKEHPSTLTATNNLGSLLMNERKWDQAEPLLRRALDASRRASDDDHPDTLYAINNLAVLMRRRGEFEQREQLFREGLERSQRTLGPQHPLTHNFHQKLGQLLTETGRVEDAKPFVRAAQAVAEAPAEN